MKKAEALPRWDVRVNYALVGWITRYSMLKKSTALVEYRTLVHRKKHFNESRLVADIILVKRNEDGTEQIDSEA